MATRAQTSIIGKHLQGHSKSKYAVVHNKNASIGIRRKFCDKRQIFSSGKGLNEKKLRSWAVQVLQQLAGGLPEADAKTWIDGKLSKMLPHMG